MNHVFQLLCFCVIGAVTGLAIACVYVRMVISRIPIIDNTPVQNPEKKRIPVSVIGDKVNVR